MASPKTVLLAEDEPNIAESLTFLLEHAGYVVSVATDGQQALDHALNHQPDERAKKLPILVLTAKSQDKDRETALDCGADLFITKPFANSEVIEAVNRIVADD
jgi:DNA-binding response OmpR family regulator